MWRSRAWWNLKGKAYAQLSEQAAGDPAVAGERPLQFADPALERAVRGRLVGADGPLYPADVQVIDSLTVEWPEPGEERLAAGC